LKDKIAALKVGDPTVLQNWMGPVTTANALSNFEGDAKPLREHGERNLDRGERMTEGQLSHGFFVAPTLAEAPAGHSLFREEMFLPIVMLCRVANREEAMQLANDSPLGLTAGVYGNDEDIAYFFDNIEAGVCYANRPQG